MQFSRSDAMEELLTEVCRAREAEETWRAALIRARRWQMTRMTDERLAALSEYSDCDLAGHDLLAEALAEVRRARAVERALLAKTDGEPITPEMLQLRVALEREACADILDTAAAAIRARGGANER